jgi:hypothetical protein
VLNYSRGLPRNLATFQYKKLGTLYVTMSSPLIVMIEEELLEHLVSTSKFLLGFVFIYCLCRIY